MKRFLPVALAALMIGCGAAPNPPATPVQAAPPVAEAPKPPPAPEVKTTTVGGTTWSITLPEKWVYDDDKSESEEDELTQVLHAKSTYNVGRGPIHLVVNTIPFDGPDVAFAQIASLHANELVRGSQVIGRRMVVLDDRPASLTVLVTKTAIQVAVVATASSGTGYVITCGGDAAREDDAKKVALTCTTAFKSFKIKDTQ